MAMGKVNCSESQIEYAKTTYLVVNALLLCSYTRTHAYPNLLSSEI